MFAFMKYHHNLIPPMQWELGFQKATGLSLDQARFVIAFFVSVYAGVVIRIFKTPTGIRAERLSMSPEALLICFTCWLHPPKTLKPRVQLYVCTYC